MDERNDDQLWALAASDDVDVRHEALAALARRAIEADDWERALTLTSSARDAANVTGDDFNMGNALSAQSAVLWELQRHTEAIAGFLDAAEHFERCEMGAEAGLAYIQAASAMCDEGLFTSVKPLLLRAHAAFVGESDWAVLPEARTQIGGRLSIVGLHEDALELIRLGLQVALDADNTHAIRHGRMHEAHALACSGDVPAAIAYVDDMRALLGVAEEPLERCRWTALGGAVLVDDEQFERARTILLDSIEHDTASAPPQVQAELQFHLARAQWGLGLRDEALATLAEARDLVDQCDPDSPEVEPLAHKLDYELANWMVDLEEWEAAEAAWCRLHDMGSPQLVSFLANRIAHALLMQERYAEALTVLDGAPDEDLDLVVRGGAEWVWRQYVRSDILAELGRWPEADITAERALRLAEDDVYPGLLARLWEARALANLDVDLDASSEMFSRACHAYRIAGETEGAEDSNEQLGHVLALQASRWDRRQSPEGGVQ